MLGAKKRKNIAVILVAIAIGFVILTFIVILLPPSWIDVEFSKEVQEDKNPLLDHLMELISWFGYNVGALVTVFTTALLFLIFKYKREALFIVLTLLSGLVSTVVKLLVNRPRPTPELVRVIVKSNQQSFPSGHVQFYVVFFGFLILLMIQLISIPKTLRIVIGAICVLLILSIPFSRIYLGAHWFTDVLGGFLLGLLCLYTLSYFYEKRP